MWKTLYFLAFVTFLAGFVGFGFMFVYGLFHERFYWKALVWLFTCSIFTVGMWSRFRRPPKDPIFERE
jgi:hypothetical protein